MNSGKFPRENRLIRRVGDHEIEILKGDPMVRLVIRCPLDNKKVLFHTALTGWKTVIISCPNCKKELELENPYTA